MDLEKTDRHWFATFLQVARPIVLTFLACLQASSAGAVGLAADHDEGVLTQANRRLDEDEGGDSKSKDYLSLKAEFSSGYRSNLFEVNTRQEPPVGAWFENVSLEARAPLKFLPSGFSVGLDSFWKRYLSQNDGDEYRAKPTLEWEGGVSQTMVLLEGYAGRFRHPVFFESERVFPKSQEGWFGGWQFSTTSKISESVKLTAEGSAEFQSFDKIRQDNLQNNLNAAIAWNHGGAISLSLGLDFHSSHYAQRPPEDEESNNPARLDVVNARAQGRAKAVLNGNWSLASELSIGPDLDFTNGYYDAAVAAGSLELHYRSDKWEIKLAGEPELRCFRRRPANLQQPKRRLTSTEYGLELGVEYHLTKSLKLFCADTMKVVVSNSNQGQADATLNGFHDNSASVGMRVSF